MKRYMTVLTQYNRAVTTEEGARIAKENEALFAEVSARLGTNVHELFMNLASTLPGNEGSSPLKLSKDFCPRKMAY